MTLGGAHPRADADREARLRAIIQPSGTIRGWATVDLDRVMAAVAPPTSGAAPTAVEAPPSELLGASCRLLRQGDASEIVLLEPSTEGRLTAALARHGEGWLVTWLRVDAAALTRAAQAGVRLSSKRRGPLGPERLVLGRPRAGPFVLLVGPHRR